MKPIKNKVTTVKKKLVPHETLVVIDVQPEYMKSIYWFREFISFINNEYKKFNNIIFLYNGSDTVGEMNENEYRYWLMEEGIDEDVLDKIIFYDKGYAFFRFCMDRGQSHDSIVNLVRMMREKEINDSRELDVDFWNEFIERYGDEDIRNALEHSGDMINIPDLMDFIDRYDNILLTGGAREECLKEVEIALEALDKKYKIHQQYVYKNGGKFEFDNLPEIELGIPTHICKKDYGISDLGMNPDPDPIVFCKKGDKVKYDKKEKSFTVIEGANPDMEFNLLEDDDFWDYFEPIEKRQDGGDIDFSKIPKVEIDKKQEDLIKKALPFVGKGSDRFIEDNMTRIIGTSHDKMYTESHTNRADITEAIRLAKFRTMKDGGGIDDFSDSSFASFESDKFRERARHLQRLGFKRYGSDFHLPGVYSLYWEKVNGMSDEDWNQTIEDIKSADLTKDIQKNDVRFESGGKINQDDIEKFIAKYNLWGQNSSIRLKFKRDPQRYFPKNIHPDRKHIFVYFEERGDGHRTVRNKLIADIESVNEKPASVNDFMENGGNLDNFSDSNKIHIFTNKSTKDEIRNIISGTSPVTSGAIIQAAASYIRGSQSPSEMAGGVELRFDKKEELKKLIEFIDKNKLWIDVDLSKFTSEGFEQQVYLLDDKTVIKLNSGFFYSSWLDYFHNLLLHNYFFPSTAYSLLGFYKLGYLILAVVQQPFIKATQKTDLNDVRKFMSDNGFANTKKNDYYNENLGISIDDLHAENVLTRNDILYFIDTIFSLKDSIATVAPKMTDGGKFKNLFNQIQKGNYKPISSDVWESLKIDGFPDDVNDFDGTNYKMLRLEIPSEDKKGLIESNENVIEKYNDFDIELKNTGWLEKGYLDIIDYDKGNIYIIKHTSNMKGKMKKSHSVKKYLVGGQIGSPEWTEQIIKDANDYFKLLKIEPVGEDYVRYIQSTLKEVCTSNLKTAQDYYKKWLLNQEASMRNGGRFKLGGKITVKDWDKFGFKRDKDTGYSDRFKGATNKAGDVATGEIIFDDPSLPGEFIYEDQSGNPYQSTEIPAHVIDFKQDGGKISDKQFKDAVLRKFGVSESDIVQEGNHTHEAEYKPIFEIDDKHIQVQFSTGQTKDWNKGGTYTSYLVSTDNKPYKGKYSAVVRISRNKNNYTNDTISDKSPVNYEEFDSYADARNRILSYLNLSALNDGGEIAVDKDNQVQEYLEEKYPGYIVFKSNSSQPDNIHSTDLKTQFGFIRARHISPNSKGDKPAISWSYEMDVKDWEEMPKINMNEPVDGLDQDKINAGIFMYAIKLDKKEFTFKELAEKIKSYPTAGVKNEIIIKTLMKYPENVITLPNEWGKPGKSPSTPRYSFLISTTYKNGGLIEEKQEIISAILYKSKDYTPEELSKMSIDKLREINSKLSLPTYEDVTGKGPSRTGGPYYSEEFEKRLGIPKKQSLIQVKSVTIIDSEGKSSYTNNFPKDFADFLSASEFIKNNLEIKPGMGYYKHSVKAEWTDGEDWREGLDIGDRENNPNEYSNIFGAYILDVTFFYIAIAEKDGKLPYMDYKEVMARAKGYVDFITKYDFQIQKEDWKKVLAKKADDFSGAWAKNFSITPYHDADEFYDVITKWIGKDFINNVIGVTMQNGGVTDYSEPLPEYNYVTVYDKTKHYGGPEEGGWFYNWYTPLETVEIKSPDEFVPVASKMMEKHEGEQEGQLVLRRELTYQESKTKKRPVYMQDGGTIHLEGVTHLPYEISVYVPSTKDVDKKITKEEINQRASEVTKFLADKFGGFTSMQTTGGYLDHTHKLVKEPVIKITSFSTEKDFTANRENLIHKVRDWSKEWGQEAVGLEFEGDLYYVSDTDKKSDGGKSGYDIKKAPMLDNYFITGPRPSFYHGRNWFADLDMKIVERNLTPDRFEEFKKKYYLDLTKQEATKFIDAKMKARHILN